MIRVNSKEIRNRDYIFVDFFDTIMFREIHSHQMTLAWDMALSRKLTMEEGILTKARKHVISASKCDECAIPYNQLCNGIYDIVEGLIPPISRVDFFRLSKEIEVNLELGVQNVNREMLEFLKKQKSKGKRIVLVSDFYLPADSYSVFGRAYNLDALFDYVYCSSEIGKTKCGNGDLYHYVLTDLGITAEQAIMIGDSLVSDVNNARKNGIFSIRYFPLFHKIRTNICKRFNKNCKNSALKNVKRVTRKYCAFGEYVFPLVYFTKKLYVQLRKNNEDANFLSRGGFFLKELLDAYLDVCIPLSKQLKTTYLLNSRKVNKLAETDPQAKQLLKDYLHSFVKNGTLSFVDEGWYGNGQLIFTRTLGLKTKGYYLGLMRNFPEPQCERKGLLFGLSEGNRKSDYYGVFRTNCTFYEQILTAPHGSVQRYYRDDGEIEAELAENIKEKSLYENYTKGIQTFLLDYAKAIFVWECELSDYGIASRMLRTLLFANKKKRELLQVYDESYFNNAVDDSQKGFGHINQIKINILELICSPEEYLRYFCKLREKCKSSLLYAVYVPIGCVIYCWCRASLLVKKALKKRGNNEES